MPRLVELQLLIAAACLALAHNAHAAPTPTTTYVIQTQQQPKDQPYPRGVSNQQLNVTIGNRKANSTYLQMIDSGSQLLSLPCNTPASAGRHCSTKNAYYTLGPHRLLSKKTCLANTSGACFNPKPSKLRGECSWSSQLTGGTGYSVYSGIFGTDTVTLPGSLGQPLSWPGIFACFDSYISCGETDSACKAPYEACPPGPAPRNCPSGTGLEAGLLFGKNSISTQLFNMGMINKAVGFCYLPPARNSNCSAPPVYNTSRVVLGSGRLPKSIPSLASMQSEPIILYLAPSGANGTTLSVSPEFRTVPTSVSLQTHGGAKPTTVPLANATILWDTGAYSHAWVPSSVFTAYNDSFFASLAQANATGKIRPCGGVTQVQSLCGQDFYQLPSPLNPKVSLPAPNACNLIQLPASAGAAETAAAERTLLSLYPPSLNITMTQGGVASLPTAVIVHDCTNTAATTVAVCSYITPQGGPDLFWLASPWFNNHYSLFEMAAPDPRSSASVGTMRWAPVSDCAI